MELEFWDKPLANILAVYNKFNTLEIQNDFPGGYGPAVIELIKPLKRFYREFKRGNGVVVRADNGDIAWEGWVDLPLYTDPDLLKLSCLPWTSTLTEFGVGVDQPEQKGSAYITAMLTGSNCRLVTGYVATTDYAAPALTCIPYRNHNDNINSYWSYNDNWYWGVLAGRTFWWMPLPSTPMYYVYRNDCEQLEIAEESPPYANRVYYQTAAGGSAHVEDTVEQLRFGRIVCETCEMPDGASDGQRAAIATVQLNYMKTAKNRGDIKIRKIFRGTPGDRKSKGYDKSLVRSGSPVRILDYVPADGVTSNFDAVNGISTYRIRSAKYTHQDNLLTISPSEHGRRVEVLLARIAAEMAKKTKKGI